MAQTFTIVTESEDFRPYRLTFNRNNYGAFPSLIKVERQQTNGRETYWTQHRTSCHGDIPGNVQYAIATAKESIRFAK